ncbi:response regulator transcription factor [Billgrantia desiderata]|uniref:response regulator transcription factor n=1 Tax=Billgrantia desiderata TaxID=52021 RepID=UPI001F342272|nr:response regulator transcription factor [Halomonas desiderata]MCE8012688.1 response regulator transcription factor [Halomonas desiderata]
MKLLLLEDDDLLAESMKDTLKEDGYVVDWAASIREAESFMSTESYVLTIIDLGLPDGSGLELLERWRKQGWQLPILILTARDTWEDKVVGLRGGADDYLTKPFHMSELMARIYALIRRRSGGVANILSVNGIELDEFSRRVSVNGGCWQELTSTEYRLLRYLMRHPDRVYSKLQLLDQLYSLEQDAADPNLVEVYISRLRRRLGKEYIQTRRGQGYLFVSH